MSELGEFLRTARQNKGASLEDVAEATRISPIYLEALEHGDYGALPGAAYITGFLRNYANYVGLHPDDAVQEYYASRPLPQPTIKAATRVLANGRSREHRSKLLWGLASVFLMLSGGFAVKQYSDTYAKPTPLLNVTPANVGAINPTPPPRHPARLVHLRLRATAPAWIRVTVDGRRVYQGILRPHQIHKAWSAHRSIYVVTLDGANVKAVYDGRRVGRLAATPGLVVNIATPNGWSRAS